MGRSKMGSSWALFLSLGSVGRRYVQDATTWRVLVFSLAFSHSLSPFGSSSSPPPPSRGVKPPPPPPPGEMREGLRDRGGPDAPEPPPFRGPAYKTKLCVLWRRRGGCSRANCGFAHGEAELRRPPPRSSYQPRPRPAGVGTTEIMTLESGLREDAHRVGGIPLKEIPGVTHFVTRDQVLKKGDLAVQDHLLGRGEKKHTKSLDGGKTDSSESFRTSDNDDREKDERYSSDGEKIDREAKLKQIQLDMEALNEDKSKLETILEKKVEEVRKLCNRADDLELHLNKEKEDCQRMTYKTKKLIKAHMRYKKAQEELKRSQARFERLADLLASDILKPGGKEQGSTGNATNEDPHNEMSPSDQRQNHVSASRKRSVAPSTSEEAKTGKKKREGDDMIPMPEAYEPEDALEPFKNSKRPDASKSFFAKKLPEGGDDEEGNIISSSNPVFADRYKGEDEQVHVD
ncbi:hypothetical protein ACP4OV_013826 [Aristida adscensionis]